MQLHDGKYQSCSVRGNRAVSMWSVYCVAVGTRRHDRLSATSRSVASSQSQLLMLFGVWMPQGVARTSSRSVVRSTFQQCFLSSPQPSISDSFAGQQTDIITMFSSVFQFSCSFELQAMGAISTCRSLQYGCAGVQLPFRSANLKVLSQDNLHGRSLQGPRLVTTNWHRHTDTHLVWFLLFSLQESTLVYSNEERFIFIVVQ